MKGLASNPITNSQIKSTHTKTRLLSSHMGVLKAVATDDQIFDHHIVRTNTDEPSKPVLGGADKEIL
jgi:hypothetical protein